MTQQTHRVAAGSAVLLALALAGCGGGSSSDGSSASATTPSAGSAPIATPSPSGTAPDCGRASTVQDAVHDSHITRIAVIGGCSQVAIETTLTRATGVETATKICDDAAKVAYVGNISSVTVTGADKHELAAGEKGMDSCIGEP